MSEAKQGKKIVTCPACGDPILIASVNCGIFRHAAHAQTKKAVDPHASEHTIMELMKQGNLLGCGAAFVVKKDGTVEVCSYDLKSN